jgi:predicted SnoaL-like aldol condensation-catalyzing enzyme
LYQSVTKSRKQEKYTMPTPQEQSSSRAPAVASVPPIDLAPPLHLHPERIIKMKKTLTAAAAAALLATGALADDAASIKPIVGTFLGAVLQGDVDTMRELANADYIQHNPFIPTGLEPFIELLPVLAEAGTTAENIRMFEDGNYVFMHNIWRNAEPFGAPEMVSFDIIRVDENGKVAEHWDALQPLVTETVSGRTQTDGPTEVTDLDQTEANKALAVALIEDVLMGETRQDHRLHQRRELRPAQPVHRRRA